MRPTSSALREHTHSLSFRLAIGTCGTTLYAQYIFIQPTDDMVCCRIYFGLAAVARRRHTQAVRLAFLLDAVTRDASHEPAFYHAHVDIALLNKEHSSAVISFVQKGIWQSTKLVLANFNISANAIARYEFDQMPIPRRCARTGARSCIALFQQQSVGMNAVV